MIIKDSSVHLSSKHHSVEEYQRKESLKYWTSDAPRQSQVDDTKNPRKSITNLSFSQPSTKVSLSSESTQKSAVTELKAAEDQEIMGDLNIRVLRALIERLTGKKVKMVKPVPEELATSQEHEIKTPAKEASQDNSPGFGLEYDLHESYYEAETTSFEASGKILTADGIEIDFSVDTTMSREFYQENNVSIRMGEALKDPLVINFSGSAAQLTSSKYSFDIDADGIEDSISFVTPESGFLVFDKNGDGIVNDGSELFGTKTGDGFAELATYDTDKSGWIDEGDEIFDELQIWIKEETGVDHLYSVAEKGVGAIYLGNISTSFSIKDPGNNELGEVAATGIYVTEDFTVGTVQKLDLVV